MNSQRNSGHEGVISLFFFFGSVEEIDGMVVRLRLGGFQLHLDAKDGFLAVHG